MKNTIIAAILMTIFVGGIGYHVGQKAASKLDYEQCVKVGTSTMSEVENFVRELSMAVHLKGRVAEAELIALVANYVGIQGSLSVNKKCLTELE